jgi:tetratricopeptide (TPR) repeat protein
MGRLVQVTLCVWCFCALAVADKNLDDAKAHDERAMSAYALGRFAEAAQEYEKAFELKPYPALLYNAAQAHRVSGNKARALLLYQNYLRVFGDRASNAADVRRHISELKQAIESEERSKTSPPVEPFAPGSPARSTTPSPPPTVPVEKPVVNEEAKTTAVTAKTPGPAKALVKKPWFWVVVVGAAAVVATGLAVGIVYGSAKSQDPVPSMGVASGN